MSEMDQKYIAPLLEVHGEDFVAMFRDMMTKVTFLKEASANVRHPGARASWMIWIPRGVARRLSRR